MEHGKQLWRFEWIQGTTNLNVLQNFRFETQGGHCKAGNRFKVSKADDATSLVSLFLLLTSICPARIATPCFPISTFEPDDKHRTRAEERERERERFKHDVMLLTLSRPSFGYQWPDPITRT